MLLAHNKAKKDWLSHHSFINNIQMTYISCAVFYLTQGPCAKRVRFQWCYIFALKAEVSWWLWCRYLYRSDVWLGLFNDQPSDLWSSTHFTWEGDCIHPDPPSYLLIPWSVYAANHQEPNNMDVDYCVRAVIENNSQLKWRTINCKKLYTAVCLFEAGNVCLIYVPLLLMLL